MAKINSFLKKYTISTIIIAIAFILTTASLVYACGWCDWRNFVEGHHWGQVVKTPDYNLNPIPEMDIYVPINGPTWLSERIQYWKIPGPNGALAQKMYRHFSDSTKAEAAVRPPDYDNSVCQDGYIYQQWVTSQIKGKNKRAEVDYYLDLVGVIAGTPDENLPLHRRLILNLHVGLDFKIWDATAGDYRAVVDVAHPDIGEIIIPLNEKTKAQIIIPGLDVFSSVGGKWNIVYPNTKMKVYKEDGTTVISSGAWQTGITVTQNDYPLNIILELTTANPEELEIEARFIPNWGEGPSNSEGANVKVKIRSVDLDIDSDNNNGFGAPGRTIAEDQMENITNDPAKPGKFIETNYDDNDDDCIPDFADGFNRDGINGNVDDTCANETFTPLVLEIPSPININIARIKLIYSASDPAAVNRIGTEPNYRYEPAPGNLRIWKRDGAQARNKNSVKATSNPGDYIPSDTYEDLSKLGFSTSTRIVTFYVEAVAPSSAYADQQIKVEIDPDGSESLPWIYVDAVRITSVKPDINIDSDNNDAIEGFDDPIEAKEPGAIIPKDLKGDTPGTDYLKPITLTVAPILPAGKIVLSAGAGVKIWTNANQTGEVTPLPKTYDPPNTLPATLYIDGVTKGSKPDIQITYYDQNNLQIGTDKVKALITETVSWAPAKKEKAYIWSSLPSLGTSDGQMFYDQIDRKQKIQGFKVKWLEDKTGSSDTSFGDCKFSNYTGKMPNCGIFTVISHGGEGAHYAVYAEYSPAGQRACDRWRRGQNNMVTEEWPGDCYTVRVSSKWLADNWANSLNTNKAITLWSICYSATANAASGEAAVKEAAGGRWRSGYKRPVGETEARNVNEKFLKRMNGTTDASRRRTAGEAYDGGTGYYDPTNLKMDGNNWTTLCPAPMADDSHFPAVNPGNRYGWGCIIFDTYMRDNIPADRALLSNWLAKIYDRRWVGNAHGKFAIGFDYDKTTGQTITMTAKYKRCRNSDPDGGRALDQDRKEPNKDDFIWSY